MQVNELEALLFVAGEEGLHKASLGEVYGIDLGELEQLIAELESQCHTSSRPYMVIGSRDTVSLVTKSQYGACIAQMRNAIERQPLSRPQLEILSFLAYGGPASKVDVDTYRGVNSVQPLRALSLRGMIERVGESRGSYVYALSADAQRSLGITDVISLPNFTELHQAISQQVAATTN